MNIKDLLKHILLIVLFLGIIMTCVMLWLRFYTNHGQKITLTEYVGMSLEDAQKDAKKNSFRLVVSDSVHQVGKAGGEIISQNPVAGSQVKENRKIYLTTTKYAADIIPVASLPTLYGTEYNSKCKDLAYMEINCKIKSYKYDAGEKDHILEVYYKDQLICSNVGRKNDVKIEKGASLDLVLSTKRGAQVPINSYRCSTLAAARFAIESSGLVVGDINHLGNISNEESAIVVRQSPQANGDLIVESGTAVHLTIQQDKPKDCN